MKPLDRTELVRNAWITALRTQGHRQCHRLWHTNDGRVCALELLREIVEVRTKIRDRNTENLAKFAGLNGIQASQVIWWNDVGDVPVPLKDPMDVHFLPCGPERPLTFGEIADRIELMFAE